MIDIVANEIRRVASETMMPRFGRLNAGEIEEKSPGEIVTLVDREVEAALSASLARTRPGARIVGEEGAAAAPELLDDLGAGEVWLIDPLDGTANFAAGHASFAIMVAMLREGETVASWMYGPVDDVMHVAERGGGAWRNGNRMRCSNEPATLPDLRGAILTRFLPDDVRARVAGQARRLGEVLPGLKCAGEDYPRIVDGRQDFALFWRSLPWDHAPGALYLEEAGGRVARPDGGRYGPARAGAGLLAARSAAIWDDLRGALLG